MLKYERLQNIESTRAFQSVMTTHVMQHSFKLSVQTLWPYSLVALLIALGINAPFLLFDYTKPEDLITELLSWHSPKTLIALLSWMFSIFLFSTLILKFNSILIERPAPLTHCLSKAAKHFFPFLLLTLLYMLIIACGVAFLVFPGIIFSVSLMFGFIFRLIEENNVLDALVESHHLIWGHWWYSLMIISIPLLVQIALFLILYMTTVGFITQFETSWPHASQFAFGLHVLLQGLFIPLIISTALCLFHDLKQKRAL